ncbi:MAG: hypothetical protein EPO24_03190 [Bacteroidetes bacterium]|nr:MAG: hypothetical protein EPO24_03190 [Bacteroidota bacterium]
MIYNIFKNDKANSSIQNIVMGEIAGKNAAIHAYDKMMWTVRSGYLILVFDGLGFIVKFAIENGVEMPALKPYVLLFSAFTIIHSRGAYEIDRNYARRKFRVIYAE